VRRAFCNAMLSNSEVPGLVFLTGDLGYNALEQLRDALADRFINAGVAEQNMISVAAGLARKELRPWAYSIAPFIYARPFEHIRNDICLHRLPVVLVGNGGGYGYGVMGGTHHALEDYGVLLALRDVDITIPAFDSDVAAVISDLMQTNRPAYLRLGLSEEPKGWQPPIYSGWRQLVAGGGATVIAVGPLAGAYVGACLELPYESRPNLWALCRLPLPDLPAALIQQLSNGKRLIFAEEHVAQGSAGHSFIVQLVKQQVHVSQFQHVTALGYPSGRYGSQAFHRRECGLDAASVLNAALSGYAL
jgi:transketolase